MRRKMWLSVLGVLFISGLFFVGPLQASSLKESIVGQTEQAGKGTYDTTRKGEEPLLATVQGGISVVLGILGVIAVIMILYAGFLWLTAGGGEEQVTKAKKVIRQAVIGLIIISLAYGLVGFIFRMVPTSPEKTTAEIGQESAEALYGDDDDDEGYY